MSGPTLELADIFRLHGPAYRKAHPLPLYQHRLMQAIETCRTEVLGGSVEWCDHCQYTHTVYRSQSTGGFLPDQRNGEKRVDCRGGEAIVALCCEPVAVGMAC